MARAIEGTARKLVDFGKSSIQASADVEAEIALYEQVFGELEVAANGVLESISKDTNILSTRLRGVGTSAFMQFKGAGVDAAGALAAMDKYTRLAADAAAAYNISIEDADVKLRSFLRGNMEAGDSINLFTSESQRNERAVAAYGAKWTELTEAQKQMLMLNVVEEIYNQQEIIGQAAREGHEWGNVILNLNEAFELVQATIGGKFREALIPVIENITGFLKDETVQMRIGMLADGAAKIAGYAFDGVIEFIDVLWGWSTGEERPNDIAQAIFDISGSLGDIVGMTFDGVIKFIKLLFNGLDANTASNVEVFLEDISKFVDDPNFQNAAAVIAGIFTATLAGALIAGHPLRVFAGIIALIVTHWDEVKNSCQYAWQEISTFCQQTFVDPISGVLENISGWFSSVASWAETAALKVREFFGITGTGDASNPNNPYGTNWHGAASIGESSNSPYSSNYHVNNGKGAFDNISSGLKSLLGFATGLDYVPYNDFAARLHEGEAVLTKTEATEWRKDGGDADMARIVSQAVIEAVAPLYEAVSNIQIVMDGRAVGNAVSETVSRNIAKNAWNRRYQNV